MQEHLKFSTKKGKHEAARTTRKGGAKKTNLKLMHNCPWAVQRRPQLLAGRAGWMLSEAMQMLQGPCSYINAPLNPAPPPPRPCCPATCTHTRFKTETAVAWETDSPLWKARFWVNFAIMLMNSSITTLEHSECHYLDVHMWWGIFDIWGWISVSM